MMLQTENGISKDHHLLKSVLIGPPLNQDFVASMIARKDYPEVSQLVPVENENHRNEDPPGRDPGRLKKF